MHFFCFFEDGEDGLDQKNFDCHSFSSHSVLSCIGRSLFKNTKSFGKDVRKSIL